MNYPFSHNAAACVCLAKLARRRGLPITESQLIEKYRPNYELWSDHPGMTDTAMVCDIARGLGLAKSVQVLRCYDCIMDCVNHRDVQGVLAFTEKFRAPGGDIVPRYDCSLVDAMTTRGFTLWTPLHDQVPMTRSYAAKDWDTLLAHALILA